MQVIKARSQQLAMPQLLSTLYDGEQKDGVLVVDQPVVFTFEQPRERLLFWPGIRRNPAQELVAALAALKVAEDGIEAAVAGVAKGNHSFLFSTPVMVAGAKITGNNCLDMYGIISDPNPFTGAFGQANLQLSILQEMMAHAGKLDIGELTVQHQGLHMGTKIVEQLFQGALGGQRPADPYAADLKPRKIDMPIDVASLLDPALRGAMGRKSKWSRLVAGPILDVGECKTPQEGLALCKKIKADDWRRATIEWCEALIQAADEK